MNNGDYTERISQESQRQKNVEGGILAFAQRVLEEIETFAGTTACSIDEIKRPFASKEVLNDGGPVSDVKSVCKD